MKAMIFAAGLGTRMRPITDSIPKALVPIGELPLLEIVIRRLMYFGIREIVINVHYKSALVLEFLKQKNNFGIDIKISDESDMLLETGGGLRKAAHFFDDNQPILVCNTDILSSIDIHALQTAHLQSNAIATVAIRNRKSSRYFLFDDELTLCGWQNTSTDEVRMSRSAAPLTSFAFSGFQILSPAFLKLLPNDKPKYSIIDVYLEAAKTQLVKGFVHNEDTWGDIGTPQHIDTAKDILKGLQLADF